MFKRVNTIATLHLLMAFKNVSHVVIPLKGLLME